MNKEFVLKSWELIKDAMNGNNDTITKSAIDDLFFRISIDTMNNINDYMDFKNQWYNQMKNK